MPEHVAYNFKQAPGPGMMRALRFHGQQDIRLDQIPIPVCGKGQVKVKPAFVGICGTDLHEYLGGANLIPSAHAHPITGEKVPLTLGHEFSGTVVEVGEGVTSHRVGDRVCVQPIIFDGTCGACVDGYINCCYSNGFIGLSGCGGGLSDFTSCPATSAIPLPDAVSLEVGALVEPLSVAWHAVKASPFAAGDAVLVIGGGPIGLALVQVLRAKGAGKIIVSEVSPRRKQFSAEFGADHVLDPTTVDVVTEVRRLCGGQGVHVGFDAAGVPPGLKAGIECLRARGTLVNVAIWEKPTPIFPNDLVFKERKYMGVATFIAGDFAEVLDAIVSGAIKPANMITKKVKLADTVSEGFNTLINDKDNHVKVLVEID
ncbi:unnamed protein product [Diplocarpon coronariae]|uniref:(R,R)-butanediol dehydrogenase n=1 Tax=Diplocarpon coronariae TaxID=2795749 RepID=A0A218ZDN7_9HELO|nr:hypothetical protein JHW43_003790 [Diplocarpon mali]OWP05852.1 (R,R)-butanediol dehydrogenase [Marssonina coronariae]